MMQVIKKIYSTITLFFIGIASLSAQSSEIGLVIGANNYLGELNSGPFNNPRLSVGVIYRYSLANNRIVLRANLNYGYVVGADSLQNSDFEQNRNLSFRSRIIELSGVVEVNFLPYEIGSKVFKHTPYMYSGLTYFNMRPQAELYGEYKDLQPLGTEGQGMEGYADYYKSSQIAIPFGLGYKINLSSAWALNVEWGIRFTFTDYLDDVSTVYADPAKMSLNKNPLSVDFADKSPIIHQEGDKRGNPYDNDIYTFYGVMLTYRIGGRKDPCSYLKKM